MAAAPHTNEPGRASSPADGVTRRAAATWIFGEFYRPSLVLCGLAVVGLLVATTTFGLLLELRDQALADMSQLLARNTVVLADGAERAFESVQLAQDAVVDELHRAGAQTPDDFRRLMSGPDARRQLSERTRNLPQLAATSALDVDGNVINFSRDEPVPKLNVASRDYFKALRDNPSKICAISMPLRSQYTGKWVIALARKVRSKDGAFIGVIVSSLRVEYFTALYDSLTDGPGSTIAMFRSDGVLLVHAPPLDGVIGQSIGAAPFFRDFRSRPDQQLITRQIGALDGRDRLIASHKLVRQPILINATTTVSTALIQWHRLAAYMIVAASFTEMVIGWLALLIVRQSRSQRMLDEVRGTQLQSEKQRLNAATELEALVVAMPGVLTKHRHLPDGSWVKVYVAPSIIELTGYNSDEALERGWMTKHVTPDQEAALRECQSRAVLNGQAKIDIDFEHRDGRLRRLHAQMRAHAQADGQYDLIIVWSDVTLERALSAQLAQAGKMAVLGELATGMAHELNQPLAAITLAAENAAAALPRMPGSVQRVEAKLELISTLAQRMASIIDHMRVYGRTGAQPTGPVHLAPVLESADSMLARKLADASVRLEVTVQHNLPPVLAKEVPLEQVLLNLVANACDAYTNKAAAEIPLDQRVVWVAAEALGDKVQIMVRDSAGGIPDALLHRIFEPFFTTKPVGQGTGLGLSISYGIITDMGGTIEAFNENGGMLFRIVLPAVLEPAI